MIKSFKLKIYPNKGKGQKLEELIAFWQGKVQEKIDFFWGLPKSTLKENSKPISEYRSWGNRIENDATLKAWQIVRKELVELYPETNFTMEDLLFKGKRKRSKQFRRRNKNWAYKWLGKQLADIGKLEGFQVLWVNPANSSITCPACKYIDKANRNGDSFKCFQWGYQNQADIVGAINIAKKGWEAWWTGRDEAKQEYPVVSGTANSPAHLGKEVILVSQG